MLAWTRIAGGSARLPDGSPTEEELPYLVMDDVEGGCSASTVSPMAPPIEERLRLFLAICSAVQYAHPADVYERHRQMTARADPAAIRKGGIDVPDSLVMEALCPFDP